MTITRAEAQPVRDAVRDDAWDAVVALDREHGQKLYGYALRLGADTGRAADLVQEALTASTIAAEQPDRLAELLVAVAR